ncbi:glycosyltransferase family 2 protein [Algivirga pacifica]|uniref:Glycosyltransferase 2-like domain-containing protein n=1 Tax=Algivirga pacifica TaxID=1162670 RepID=A0ABP9D8M6_9BACT
MIQKETVIILVNYNGYQDTLECIQSISKSEGQEPFIVVVDNCSQDANRIENLYDYYSSLKVIISKENIGFGRANNLGIKWAQENIDFEYLLLLNNDTIIESNTLSELKKPFLFDSEIGISTCKTMYEGNRDIVWYGGGTVDYKIGWPIIKDFNVQPTDSGANQSKYVTFISGCCMMFSKKSLTTIGGFDEHFFMYCEDLEMSIRAVDLGFKLYYSSDARIFHKVQRSLKGSEGAKAKGMSHKNPNLSFLFKNMKMNQYYTFVKYLSGRRLLIFKVNYWSRFIYKSLLFLLRGRTDLMSTIFTVVKANLAVK